MDTPRVDVLTVGHALMDVLVNAPDSLLSDEGMEKGTMQLIDAERASRLHESMSAPLQASGGSSANTATGVVACGATAAFVGTVGNDELGQSYADDLRSAGVAFEVPPVAGAPTGRSLIFVTPDGQRTMNTFIGAAEAVSMNELTHSLLQSARITYVEGFLMDDRFDMDDWRRVASVIHESGNRFAVSLSDPFCVERHRKNFLDLLDDSIDICFGNADEVQMLFESNDLDECLTKLGDKAMAAVTLGAEGSVVITNGERTLIDAVPVTVVDTTGAGDLYAAGFLAGLSQGKSPAECGGFASKAAGAVISQLGGRLAAGTHVTLP